MLQCPRRCPLRIDPHTLARRKPPSIAWYRASVNLFLEWCRQTGTWPNSYDELDDLLVEWKNDPACPPKMSQFVAAVAATEPILPCSKMCLPWSRAVSSDWQAGGNTNHHKPIPRSIAQLFATVFALLGYSRLGAGLIIQQSKGGRPSELLDVKGQDVCAPSNLVFGQKGSVVVSLGARTGTKSRRAQASVATRAQHFEAVSSFCELSESTSDE